MPAYLRAATFITDDMYVVWLHPHSCLVSSRLFTFLISRSVQTQIVATVKDKRARSLLLINSTEYPILTSSTKAGRVGCFSLRGGARPSHSIDFPSFFSYFITINP